ncbi:MAG: radical SAM protein, partial [Bullifex sp.]|nr:radical SAM protein [Spirochaetales bacterium]MDY5776579.1 radical SAM protein [Bullifex sp.]
REGNREYFYKSLDESFPGLRERYERLYSNRYVADSPDGHRLMKLFGTECERFGLLHDNDEIFSYLREFPDPQPSLF